ncbi:hypothetical protein IAE22_25470 [Bacillus sp. S34]|nr:hypothetical protein [Bacillus sp. S34]
MPVSGWDTVEIRNQIEDMVKTFDDKTLSVKDLSEKVIENNKGLIERKGTVPQDREEFWTRAVEYNLDRLAKNGVLKDNQDGTYTKK